jgi:hypothetical protein
LNLSEFAWYTSYDITGKKPGEVKILLRPTPYPCLGKDEHGYVIFLPKMRKAGEKIIEYQGSLFNVDDKYHCLIAWNLFKTSIYYLSLFTSVSSIEAYTDFVAGRNEDLVLSAINLVEDASINAYIKVFHRSLLPEIMFANAVSYLLLKPAELIRNEGIRFSTSILSYYKTGIIKGDVSEEMLADTKYVVSLLNEFENEMAKLYSENEKQGDDSQSPITNYNRKKRIPYDIYDKLYKYCSKMPEIPSFPYMNHLNRNSIFYKTETLDVNKIKDVLDEITSNLNLKISLDIDSLMNESSQILSDWLMSERSKERVLTKYRLTGNDTHLKSFTFPEEDYAEFIRRKEGHVKSIRRIINRLSVMYNLSGEDFRRDTGSLDLQEAIQVVASESNRIDVFVDEELQYRSQAWAILVDVSHSLRAFAGEVKDVILCLTESARKLFRDNHSLGVFAFDDKFYVIKDFSESYSNVVCARIGGIEHSGMTYLPDGVKMVSEVLRRRFEETKIMVVVSDGFPSGYTRVGEESKVQIKSVLKSGIRVIGIGIDSKGIKDYFPVSCIVKTPYDLMKSFVKIYLQYAFAM